jgi:hypothetical protein
MALTITPAQFQETIRDAERHRADYLDNVQKLTKRYAGNYYRRGWKDKPVPENMIFSYLANLMPKMVFDHPRVSVKAEHAVTQEPIADAMRHILNAWAERSDVRDELEDIAYDFALGYGVAKVGLETRGDFSADPSRGIDEHFNMNALTPYLTRVNPAAFVVDPNANSFKEARWMGHQFVRDLDELAQDDRYDQEVVAKLTGLADDEIKLGDRRQEGKPRSGNGNDSNRVALYEIYLVESRQIGTLVSDQNGIMAWIRPLREFMGPEDGPYVFFGAYIVPNQVYPLSPIQAMAEQFVDLNAHAHAAAKEAASAKKLVLVDSKQDNLRQQIQNAPSGAVIGIPGLAANSVANVELGGTSVQRVQYLGQLRDRLDRTIGFSDAMRGKTSGATATENEIAASAGDSRTDFIALRFMIGVREALTRIGWFYFYEDLIKEPVSWNDASGKITEGTFEGGLKPGQEDMSWFEFALTVDPYSMRRQEPAEAIAKAEKVLEVSLTIAPAVVSFPWINWQNIVQMLGDALNVPDLASRMFTEQGLAMMGQGVLPGMLSGVNGQTGPLSGIPGGANQTIQAGVQGQPVNQTNPASKSMPQFPRMMTPQIQAQSPGAQAFAELGYAGRQPGNTAAA